MKKFNELKLGIIFNHCHIMDTEMCLIESFFSTIKLAIELNHFIIFIVHIRFKKFSLFILLC